MRFIAFALALILSTPAFAGGTVFVQPSTVSTGGSNADRPFYVCFLPDIQNLTSSDDHAKNGDNSQCGVNPAAGGCPTGSSYCDASPYCQTSWRETGRRLLRNLAYDLTGQWEMQDYTSISGPNNSDGTVSRSSGTQDHPKCDVIVSLGDNSDIDDTVVCTDPTYASMTAGDKQKWDLATEFWQIIDASGIPYLVIPGNHDPARPFNDLMTGLNFSSKSFYHAGHADGDQYAIKITGPDNKPMCIIGSDYTDTTGCVRAPTASEITWLGTNVGCGGNYPTIVAEHQGVNSSGTALNQSSTLVANAANSEIIAVAGGHWTDAASSDHDSTPTGAGGFVYMPIFANWQEMNRHNNGYSPTYGVTTSDGAGMIYTVMAIDRANDRVSIWDYSPYWRSRSVPSSEVGAYTMHSNSLTFDYDARSP